MDAEPNLPGRKDAGRRSARQPLAALLLLAAVLGLFWALLVPPWQSPDETWHYAYAQSLAERFALPGAANRPAYSADEALAMAAANTVAVAFHPEQVRPPWSPVVQDRYLRQSASASRSNGGGYNLETPNPPLLYLFDAVPYLAASAGSAFAQLYAMRIWNVLLLLATALGVWLLIGEVFGRRRPVQLACAAATILIPMQTFIGTSVNPDAMLIPEWTLALWLGARVIRRGELRDTLLLCAVTAAAILTKATSYALIPPVLLAMLISVLHRPAGARSAAARRHLAALIVLAVPVLGWVALTVAVRHPVVNVISAAPGAPARPFTVGGFITYLVHFYIPGSAQPFGQAPVYLTWLRSGWAEFGWLDVSLPSGAYKLLAAFTAGVTVLALVHVVRLRGRLRLELLAFFAVALLSLLTLLHVTDYRSILAGQGRLLQGRYLLPASGLFGLSLALILTRLPRRWQAPAGALLIVSGLALQLLSLAVVARSYYA